jgi:hypothetical protein
MFISCVKLVIRLNKFDCIQGRIIAMPGCQQTDCCCSEYISCSLYTFCQDTMEPRHVKAVNLGWKNTLFVCYFYWSLERFRLVDSTIPSYSVWNNSCSCAEDKQVILPNKTEIGGQDWSECDRNIQSKDQC